MHVEQTHPEVTRDLPGSQHLECPDTVTVRRTRAVHRTDIALHVHPRLPRTVRNWPVRLGVQRSDCGAMTFTASD